MTFCQFYPFSKENKAKLKGHNRSKINQQKRRHFSKKRTKQNKKTDRFSVGQWQNSTKLRIDFQ